MSCAGCFFGRWAACYHAADTINGNENGRNAQTGGFLAATGGEMGCSGSTVVAGGGGIERAGGLLACACCAGAGWAGVLPLNHACILSAKDFKLMFVFQFLGVGWPQNSCESANAVPVSPLQTLCVRVRHAP